MSWLRFQVSYPRALAGCLLSVACTSEMGATGEPGDSSTTGSQGAGASTGGQAQPGFGAGAGTGASGSESPQSGGGTGASSSGSGATTTTDGTGGDVASGGTGTGGDGSAEPASSSCKRGIAYGNHSKADFAALSPAISWWYNWASRPDPELRDGGYLDASVEFAPMVWGGSFNVQSLMDQIPDDAEVLLGFNEPNFGEQANLSAAQAASLWPSLEEIAASEGLRLVSPAVNYCGGNCQDTNPFDYLDDFFAACSGCQVDAIGVHIYVGCNPGGDNKAQWLINIMEEYKARFSGPLWLTEFACDDAANYGEQIAFMEDALEYLERDPRVERYAWFSGRFNNMPFVNLLAGDGELTALGQAYVAADSNGDCGK